MTSSEKRVFFLGAGAGMAIVALVGGALAVRSGHVFASQPPPNSAVAQPAAGRNTMPDTQGTQPGTTLRLTPTEMTAAGVQVAEVHTAVLKTNIDAFGRVEQPESQLAAISAWIGGRVDKLYVQYTGERIRRGQQIAELYSPEVATAMEEYRLARENRARLGQSDDAYARTQAESLLDASRRKLQLWGITAEQIEAGASGSPAATQASVPHVTIFASAGGTVVERKVTQGQYVNAGETMLTLADLTEIWIKADVYEDQLPQIHPGQDVNITAEALPNRTLHGHVQFIEPTTNAQTRTVPVHVHLANPEMRLMPGMFVNATFVSRADRSSAVVPRSAVLDTGTRKIVYVAKPDGVFEAREVQLGTPNQDVFPVMSGLQAGEKVVLNGNFLIDSQAQLSSGMSGLYGGSKEFASAQQAGGSSSSGAAGARVELHSGGELKGGDENTFVATLTDASGKPVSDAQVTVTVVMPAMPSMNMPEMKNSFALAWSAAQQAYAGKGNVPMAGSWNVQVEASRNGAVIASARTRMSAK